LINTHYQVELGNEPKNNSTGSSFTASLLGNETKEQGIFIKFW